MVHLHGIWNIPCHDASLISFLEKMALDQNCGPWQIAIPTIFWIKCLMLSTLHLIISSMELSFPVTSLNIFTCGVVLSMSWIPRFNKVVNYQNGSEDIIAGYLLDPVKIIQVIFLWYSTKLLAISPNNSMWFLMIPSAQPSLFLLNNNLLLSGINVISMIFLLDDS